MSWPLDAWLDAHIAHASGAAGESMRRVLGAERMSRAAALPMTPIVHEDRWWIAATLPCALDPVSDAEWSGEVILVDPKRRSARVLGDPQPVLLSPWAMGLCATPRRARLWTDPLAWLRAWAAAREDWYADGEARRAALQGSDWWPADSACLGALVIGKPADWSPLLGPAEIVPADPADSARVKAGLASTSRLPKVAAVCR